jgi:hypothetical protein
MSVIENLTAAGVTRILMVDDDLRAEPTLKEVNECARVAQDKIEDILNDTDHQSTELLTELLERNGHPHGTLAERFRGLAFDNIREQCSPDLREPYEQARTNLQGFQEPLNKIRSWIRAPGQIELTAWSSIREPGAGEFYDMLIVDYYLTENESAPTRAFISKLLDRHKDQENPLLVILMSSDKGGVTNDLSIIRDEVGASASRFRILVKPSSSNTEPEPVVKERWLQALAQLATERSLIQPIEGFVNAWRQSLVKATDTIIKRLYELDASAFSILSATASADSMSIEEYMADVLAKRVSAETEENSEVSTHTLALQKALSKSSSTVGPTINQGVEIKDAQHAIRRLMSDVVWHRPPWHQPQSDLPNRLKSPPNFDQSNSDNASAAQLPERDIQNPTTLDVAEVAEAYQITVVPQTIPGDIGIQAEPSAAVPHDPSLNIPSEVAEITETASSVKSSEDEILSGVTEDRLVWMKRHLRFGTILRERAGRKRYFVNITQACDVQNVKLNVAADYHYLFVRGEKLAVDRVAVGEKIFESPYYAKSSTIDEFASFHWNLRQPFTPSMAEILDNLENYSIEGQLRNESAYAVLAKFLSQASRVALLRMPKIYRCPVYVFHKVNNNWELHKFDGAEQIHASCWERKPGIWCSQFQLDDAYRIVSTVPDISGSTQAKSVAALGKSNSMNTTKNHAAMKLDGDKIYLVRLKLDANMEISSVTKEISNLPAQQNSKNGDALIVVKTAEGFA